MESKMFHGISNAAMKAQREHKQSSRSLIACIEEQAQKIGVSTDAVVAEFEKLFPGLLHPTLTESTKSTTKKGKRA